MTFNWSCFWQVWFLMKIADIKFIYLTTGQIILLSLHAGNYFVIFLVSLTKYLLGITTRIDHEFSSLKSIRHTKIGLLNCNYEVDMVIWSFNNLCDWCWIHALRICCHKPIPLLFVNRTSTTTLKETSNVIRYFHMFLISISNQIFGLRDISLCSLNDIFDFYYTICYDINLYFKDDNLN